MAYFEDDKELIKALQDRVKSFVSPYVYQGLAYDDADLEDLWTLLRSQKTKKHYGKFMRKPRVSDTSIESSLPTIIESSSLGEFKLRRSEPVLKAFGLDEAIPFNELFKHENIVNKKLLSKDQWEPGSYLGVINLPRWDYIAGIDDRVHIWLADCAALPDVTVDIGKSGQERRLSYHIADISDLFNCTPGLAAVWLLTDLPVHEHLIDVEINAYHTRISLCIQNSTVSQFLVSKVYSLARYLCRKYWDSFLREVGQRDIHTPDVIRPRGVTKKVKELIEFIDNNSHLSWRELWEQWNSRNPNWQYKTLNSMRTVAYRYRWQLKSIKRRKRG